MTRITEIVGKHGYLDAGIFEAIQNTRSSVLSGLKHSTIALCFITR